MTLLEHGACAKLFMFFESQRWRLYETGQTIRMEEEAVEGEKKPHGRKVPGLESRVNRTPAVMSPEGR